MKRCLLLLACLVTISSAALAQPVANGAVNAASYASSELPNGSLAQGGMLIVFGSNMGTGNTPQVLSFPLTTTLDGVGVKVTSGGTTTDCIMIYALVSQVACILPSNTPVGNGTLTVTARGATSAALPVKVVAHSLGVFTINNAGSGPGIFTDNPYIGPNTLLHSAHANEAWTIWGTGLGPINADETNAPPVQDMTDLDVSVLVGGANAQVIYRGRSQYAGVDQINFIVPAGITGCYVPVAVTVEGVTSNFTSISIAGSGEACSESSGLLTSANLQTAQQNGSFKLGAVGLSRISLSFDTGGIGQTLDINTETGSGDFWSYTVDQLLRSNSLFEISNTGSCMVLQFRGSTGEFEDPIQATNLDAGAALTVTGPNGAKTMPKAEGGGYFETFSSNFPGLPLSKGRGPVGQLPQNPPYLTPGNYTITGPGGAQVGAFNVSLTIPERLVWTNKDSITTVDRSQNLNITWTGGDQSGFVLIYGTSSAVVTDDTFIGASFFCRASASAGSFAVPAAVLSALPVSVTNEGFPAGFLAVGNSIDGETFTASGIDLGVATFTDVTQKSVGYE